MGKICILTMFQMGWKHQSFQQKTEVVSWNNTHIAAVCFEASHALHMFVSLFKRYIHVWKQHV